MHIKELYRGTLRACQPYYASDYLPYETKDRFETNLKIQGPNWEYNHKKIFYKYNSLGHRSCEITELTSDYILFAGCSYTEGVGLALEDLYCDVVAKNLDKQYYNIGVGGSCPAITARNILSFMTIAKTQPYAIAIQWPYFYRYLRVSSSYAIHHIYPSASHNQEYFQSLTKDNDIFRFNVYERVYLLHFLYNIGYKGKIVEMFSENDADLQTILYNSIETPIETKSFSLPKSLDYARDMGHPGSLTHKLYAAKMIELLQ